VSGSYWHIYERNLYQLSGPRKKSVGLAELDNCRAFFHLPFVVYWAAGKCRQGESNMSTKGDKEMQSLRIEPSQRWVRAQVSGEFVVDCRRPVLVWEHEKYPTYFFPREDVRMDWLEEGGQTSSRTFWHLTVNNGQRVERAAYFYPKQPEVEGYITLPWHKVDHWYEEEEEVFVHARDPYKRVDVMPSSRHVQVVIDGVTVAETKQPSLLFETSLPTRYYLPAADVNTSYLTSTDSHTRCPYKGMASYWNVSVGEKVYKDLVWSYPDPIPECPKIKGLLCFYNEKVDLYVDGELQERPETYWT
jgi:uncharacterized protein (DUF427 family)